MPPQSETSATAADTWSLITTETEPPDALALSTDDQRPSAVVSTLCVGQPIELLGARLRGIDVREPAAPAEASMGRRDAPRHIDLSGANLAGAALSGADLAGVVLRCAVLDGALLVGADLRGADLSGASLRSANLSGALLRRADLSFADLRLASLLTADLTQAIATGVDCREALLQSAVLTRALLHDADLRWAHLDGARLCGADLDGARLEGAALALANLTGAHLTATTDLSYAFLHHARFDRTALARHHIRLGIGEAFADLRAARETYEQLSHHFASVARYDDARWARCRAWSMATAMHRPDRALTYHAKARKTVEARSSPPDRRSASGQVRLRAAAAALGAAAGAATARLGVSRSRVPARAVETARALSRALFLTQHTALWLLGHVAELFTGYATSARRVVAALIAVWLVFAALFRLSGAVMHVGGGSAGWPADLAYSAAALTPIDAYPLAATTELAHLAGAVEGVLGIVLLGTLGFVTASRFRHF